MIYLCMDCNFLGHDESHCRTHSANTGHELFLRDDLTLIEVKA